MTILVSVASYRDPELIRTVQDCLAKARHPDELRIVVVWQHLGDEDISAIADDPRVEILDFDARESRGACWARAQVMRHYAGEEWFLQVDSHTRFTVDWDVRVLAIAAGTGSAKPVVSCYLPAFTPETEFVGTGYPTETYVGGWAANGLPIFNQRAISDQSGPASPARFVAGGFLFAPGSLLREVPYDPHLYFHGEELTMSLRAFTWGYDLFHPNEVLAWHYYIRKDSHRHWTDHIGADGAQAWYIRDQASLRRVYALLKYPYVGRHGLGTARTLAEYAEYSGCDFPRRSWTDWRQPVSIGS